MYPVRIPGFPALQYAPPMEGSVPERPEATYDNPAPDADPWLTRSGMGAVSAAPFKEPRGASIFTRFSNPILAAQQDEAAGKGAFGYHPVPGYESPGQADQDLAERQVRGDFPARKGSLENMYQPSDEWAWRDRIRGGAAPSTFEAPGSMTFRGGQRVSGDNYVPQGAGGKPGEVIYNNYGPGFGGALVKATADARGRFNSFSDASGAPGTAGGPPGSSRSPAQIEMDKLQQQVNYYQAAGGNDFGTQMMNRINGAIAQRQLTMLRHQANQDRQVGVQERQATLSEQKSYPEINLANQRNFLINNQKYDTLQRQESALKGESPTKDVQTMGGTYGSLPPGMGPTFYPAFGVGGQAPTPVPLRIQPATAPLQTLDNFLPKNPAGSLPGW
jgi:hypothetical protein